MPRASPSGGTPSWQRYASVASFPECMRPIDPPDSAPQGMPFLLAREFGTWPLGAMVGWGRLRGRAHQNLVATTQHSVGFPVESLPGLEAPQRIFLEFHAALKNYTSTQYVRRVDLLWGRQETTEEPCYQFCPATLPSSVRISSVRTLCTDDTSL
jgi:hypothetical protein